MGSLYRSQHELRSVFKKGRAPHLNNVELGRHGRYRTNVWSFPGLASFGKDRDAALASHPTVKPVALLVEAISDLTVLAIACEVLVRRQREECGPLAAGHLLVRSSGKADLPHTTLLSHPV